MTGPCTVDDPPRVTVRPLATAEPGWEDAAGPCRRLPAATGHRRPAGTADDEPPVPATAPTPVPRPAAGRDRAPAPGNPAPPVAVRAAQLVVRTALEVVDGLRPAARAGSVFPAPLLGMLTDLARVGVPGRSLGNARLQRVYVDPALPPQRGADGEYEVCATYARGPRLFAVAARIRVDGRRVHCLALRLG